MSAWPKFVARPPMILLKFVRAVFFLLCSGVIQVAVLAGDDAASRKAVALRGDLLLVVGIQVAFSSARRHVVTLLFWIVLVEQREIGATCVQQHCYMRDFLFLFCNNWTLQDRLDE